MYRFRLATIHSVTDRQTLWWQSMSNTPNGWRRGVYNQRS